MDNRIVIAVPTYKRVNITTLTLLSAFDKKDIYLFVNDIEEENRYEEVNQGYNIVVTGTKGIQNARNAILDYFADGTRILQLDDDISAFEKLEAGIKNFKIQKYLRELTPVEIKEMIEEGFRVCEKNGAKLWGVYPVENAFYMSQSLSNKDFVIGSFAGIINNPIRFNTDLALKEDYAYTIDNIIQYKKIVRYNNITMKIAHYTNSGGCVELRTSNENKEKECFDKLMSMYPGILRANPKRENEVLMSL